MKDLSREAAEKLCMTILDSDRYGPATISLARYVLANKPGWRTIESAPKDGTNILVGWYVGATWYERRAEWDGKYWTDEALVISHAGYEHAPSYSPTHWMPLPDAPSASPEASEQAVRDEADRARPEFQALIREDLAVEPAPEPGRDADDEVGRMLLHYEAKAKPPAVTPTDAGPPIVLKPDGTEAVDAWDLFDPPIQWGNLNMAEQAHRGFEARGAEILRLRGELRRLKATEVTKDTEQGSLGRAPLGR